MSIAWWIIDKVADWCVGVTIAATTKLTEVKPKSNDQRGYDWLVEKETEIADSLIAIWLTVYLNGVSPDPCEWHDIPLCIDGHSSYEQCNAILEALRKRYHEHGWRSIKYDFQMPNLNPLEYNLADPPYIDANFSIKIEGPPMSERL